MEAEVIVEEVQLIKYPVYKDSGVNWIGEVPEHWKMIKLKYLAVIEKGKLPTKIVSTDEANYPAYMSMEYLRGGIANQWVIDKIAKVVDEDELLLLWDGSNAGEFIKSRKGVISSTVALVQFYGIKKGFAWYYSKNVEIELRNNTIGMGIPHVNGSILNNLKYFIPPKEEQTAIAQFLDRKTAQIDKAIDIKEKQIALLNERRQILIHNAVTRGLNPEVPMKDSGVEWIGEIPRHWEVVRLKYISTVQSGLTLGKTYMGQNLPTYPYLRVANVQAGFFKLDDMAEIKLPKHLAEKYQVRIDDILVTEGGDLDKLGRGTVWNGEIENCLHQNHVFAVRINKEVVSPEFASMLMESDYGRKYFTNTANKTTNLASTNSTKLGNFPLIVPPIPEQQEISAYVEEASSKLLTVISTKEKEIEKLKEYKASLINSAVTGKIKVKK